MRKFILAASALSLTVPVMSTPALAHQTGYRHSHYDQSYRCQRSGTTGTIVGGAAGALAGREIDKHGSRATGTILGAAVGALLGRHVERKVIKPKRC